MTEDRAKDAADWSNYWTGRTAGQAGAALAGREPGAGVETDAELAAFWDQAFAGLPAETRVLDLACGAGSALKAAGRAGLANLTGVDISDAAIDALKAALPGATGVVASASETGFPDGAFDRVVSQFGFEYAGAGEAAREAARLLAPGGAFIAAAHMHGGAIHAECAAKLADTEAILNTGFIEAADRVFRAAFAAEAAQTAEAKAAYDAAAQGLAGPRQALVSLSMKGEGLARHLLGGAGQLFERRGAYALEDITGWLDAMRGEIDAYAGRMRSMTRAALDEAGLARVAAALEAGGCAAEPAQLIELAGKPAAWAIRATKS